jgi:hypothetical protein
MEIHGPLRTKGAGPRAGDVDASSQRFARTRNSPAMGALGGTRKRSAAGRVLWAEPPVALSDTTLFGGVKTGFVCDLQLLQQSLLSAEASSEGRTAEFLSRLPGKRHASSNRSTDAARETARKELVEIRGTRQHVLVVPQQVSILFPLCSGPLRVLAMLCIRLPDALDSFRRFRFGSPVPPWQHVFTIRGTLARHAAPGPRAANLHDVNDPEVGDPHTQKATASAMPRARMLKCVEGTKYAGLTALQSAVQLHDTACFRPSPVLSGETLGVTTGEEFKIARDPKRKSHSVINRNRTLGLHSSRMYIYLKQAQQHQTTR